MIAKKTLIVAGVVLLATAMLAGATAHLTQANTTSPTAAAKSFGVNGNPDPCRRSSKNDAPGLPANDGCVLGARHLGVSGSFAGTAGAMVFKSAVPLNNPRVEICNTPDVRVNEDPCDAGGSLFLLAPTTLFPNGGVSAGQTLCDMEVLGDGSDADDQQMTDETIVDSLTNNAPTKPYPDGTIDDGGAGGVCHVASSNTHYSLAGYKTSGCIGNVAGTDWVAGGNAWFGVGCSVVITRAGATSASNCFLNAAIGSDKLERAQGCVAVATAPPGSNAIICGNIAGAVSLINFGFGTGRGGAGIVYPTVGVINCPVVDSSGVVFAFASYNVDTNVSSPMVGGWVDGSN